MTKQTRASGADGLAGQIERLRELVVNAEEFAEIHRFFERELACNAAFMDAGEPAHNAELVEAATRALTAVVPGGCLESVLLMHVREAGLWHGFGNWGAGVGIIVYLEDPGMGLISYSPSLADPLVHHIRFTRVQLGAPTNSVRIRRGRC